jgi:glycine C-acetyltransferase
MYGKMKDFLANELAEIKAAGLYKTERIITTSQKADIKVNAGEEVINFCANNYLGLSNNPRLIQAAKDAMDTHGFGMSSVRFICGTQDIHKTLEKKIADFYGTEDTILYAAAFDAKAAICACFIVISPCTQAWVNSIARPGRSSFGHTSSK